MYRKSLRSNCFERAKNVAVGNDVCQNKTGVKIKFRIGNKGAKNVAVGRNEMG